MTTEESRFVCGDVGVQHTNEKASPRKGCFAAVLRACCH